MKTRNMKTKVCLIVGMMIITCATGLRAQTQATWTGGGDGIYWTGNNNWTFPTLPPGEYYYLFFNQPSGATLINDTDAGYTYAGINFAAGSFNITGNAMTLAAGGTIAAAAGTVQNIGFNINLADNSNWFNVATGGTLTLNGILSGGKINTHAGSGAAGSALIKIGAGDLALNGNNTFAGGVTIAGGRVILGSNTALGVLNPGSAYGSYKLVFTSGTLEMNNHNLTLSSLQTGTFAGIPAETLNLNGIGITNSGDTLSTLTFNPNSSPYGLQNTVLSGKLRLVFNTLGGASMYLNDNNSYSGGTEMNNNGNYAGAGLYNEGGMFLVANAFSAFGTGEISLNTGGFMFNTGAGSFANNLKVTGTSKITFNTGNNTSFTGTIGGNGLLVITAGNNATNGVITFSGADFSDFTGTLALTGRRDAGSWGKVYELSAATGLTTGSATIQMSTSREAYQTAYATLNLAGSGTYNIGNLTTWSAADNSARLLHYDGSTAKYDTVTIRNQVNSSVAVLMVGELGNNGVFDGNILDSGIYAPTTGAVTPQGTGVIEVRKIGAGTWELSNSNFYSGSTTVSGGVMLISGSGSLKNTGRVTVTSGEFRYDSSALFDRAVTISGGKFSYNAANAYTGNLTFTGGVLGGTNWGGNLSGLTIDAGKTVAPGASGAGTATTGAQTWDVNGAFSFEINDAAGGVGVGWNFLDITNNLNVMNLDENNQFTIKLTSFNLANFDPDTVYAWNFANYGTLTTVGGDLDPNVFKIDAANFMGGAYDADSFFVTANNNMLTLNYVAVPEPSAWLLLACGAVLSVLVQRRQIAAFLRGRRF